jgi:outer membrane protein OmpA-like peptidoglycan-associated protein
MSLRYLSNIRGLLIVPVCVFGVGVGGIASTTALAAGTITNVPAVQTYADQAAPAQAPAPQGYYDSPLAAGTLTLQDVLEAHRPIPGQAPQLPAASGTPSATATAPILTPPVQSSATGLMMSQGMKAVLQKVGAAPANAQAPSPSVAAAPATAQGQPTSLVSGLTYEPGQAPRNLGGSVLSAPALAPSSPQLSTTALTTAVPASDTTATGSSCVSNVQKWEKSCSEAGYPATYVGQISGETRTGCSDGTLHDVWVTNSCAPPDAATSQTTKTDGVCGAASNNEFDDAPQANLCGQGIAGAVSGSGPWTWACSGVNGGEAAACAAQKSIPPVNGVCGTANGETAASAPSDDLCNSGVASGVAGEGPWTWSCKGIGKGSSESCIAPIAAAPKSVTIPAPVVAPEPVSQTFSAPEPVSSPALVKTTVAQASAPSERNELCGSAAETLAFEAPEKDLCRGGGIASPVNGDGPWTWSCTSNEGITSSCRTLSLKDEAPAEPAAAPKAAPQEAVSSVLRVSPQKQAATAPAAAPKPAEPELACGLAAGQPAQLAPSSDLCQGGKASTVLGSNPWQWTCSKGKHKVTCATLKSTDGACGAANGLALKSAPFAGLCSSGIPSGIQGDGPWQWTCGGSGGGVDVSCAASVQTKSSKVDGACGSADGTSRKDIPSEGLCSSGTPSAVSGDGPWAWSCSGNNGGGVGSCSANKIVPPKPPGVAVNGLCGAANGRTTSAQPTDNLCASGVLSGVVGNGPWNWSCSGENGGMTTSCTAPLEPPAPLDGACGAANGVATLAKPQNGLCSSGITGSVNGRGPWTWTCSGANGGNPASCVAPVAGKTGAMPSVMTPAVDADIYTSPAPASSGLVTPRLASSGSVPPLDKKVLPSLTSSKPFASAPTPTQTPSAAAVAGDMAPASVPGLSEGSEPLQPPAFRDTLPSAAVLQESATSRAAQIPGNHLTLDPTISTVLFTHGSSNIDEGVLTTLDKLAAVLQNNQDVRISLIAYADSAGSTPRDARRLSLGRALAVRDYLASKNISESRIDVHAEGANASMGYIDRVDVKVND